MPDWRIGAKENRAHKRIPLATMDKVSGLYQEKYYDLNIRHFHEKLRDEPAIRWSYTWVQKVSRC